jgi:hypothetical protein
LKTPTMPAMTAANVTQPLRILTDSTYASLGQ